MATDLFIIPTGSEPFYEQRTDLNGIEYTLLFEWSSKESVWYLSIYALDETPIALSLKLLCNIALLRKCTSPLRPTGELLVIPRALSDDSPPGKDDLLSDGRCVLAYVLVTPDAATPVPI
jgi:hypothetical protein